MSTPLIGLGGYAFAGKDAVADVLEHDHGWARTFLSKPLLDILLILDPLIPAPFSHVRFSEMVAGIGYDESKHNPEVRRLLQTLGTEIGRAKFGESVWIDLVMDEVAALREQGRNVAVTGIRFRNELDAIRAAGGLAVWVARPGFGPVNGHSSDNALTATDFDITVVNDGPIDSLPGKVDALLAYLEGAAQPVRPDGQFGAGPLPFQRACVSWALEAFGPALVNSLDERNDRFLEESLELVQSLGMWRGTRRMDGQPRVRRQDSR